MCTEISDEMLDLACVAYMANIAAQPTMTKHGRPPMRAALQAALSSQWRPIDKDAASDDLYYYPPHDGLPAVMQIGCTGLRRPATLYMRPTAPQEG